MKKIYLILLASVLSVAMYAQNSTMVKGSIDGEMGVNPSDVVAIGDYLLMKGVYDYGKHFNSTLQTYQFDYDYEVMVYDAALDSLIGWEFNPNYSEYTDGNDSTYRYMRGADFEDPILYNGLLYFEATNAAQSGVYTFDPATQDTTYVFEFGNWYYPMVADDTLHFAAGSNGPIVRWDGVALDSLSALDTLLDFYSGNYTYLNGKYIISAKTLVGETYDEEPYAYDPSQPDTAFLLKDIVPYEVNTADYSKPRDLTTVGNKAYFVTYLNKGTIGEYGTASYSKVLWETDGTPEGTMAVDAVNAGVDSLDMSLLYVDGEVLYLAASMNKDKSNMQLLTYNTTSGAVAQISNVLNHDPEYLVKQDGWIYYAGVYEEEGAKHLLRTDGSVIEELDTLVFDVAELTILNDVLFFSGEMIEDSIITTNDTTLIYSGTELFKYALPPNTDATLASISVDGEDLADFDPETLTYTVTLPATYDTSVMPDVEAVATDAEEATVNITEVTAPGTASIEVTAHDGSTKLTYSVTFEVESSVADLAADDLKVYPTVSNGLVTVELGAQGGTVQVYEITGKVVMNETYADAKVQFSLEENGMYIVRISNDDASKVVRVVKR